MPDTKIYRVRVEGVTVEDLDLVAGSNVTFNLSDVGKYSTLEIEASGGGGGGGPADQVDADGDVLDVDSIPDTTYLRRSGSSIIGRSTAQVLSDIGAASSADLATEATARGNADTALAAPQYLVLAATATLANERAFTIGHGLDFTDAGAGASYTVDVDESEFTYGSSGSVPCVGNDARLSDARTPTGSASGDLAGTYPSPTVTQARGLRTAGGTTYPMGSPQEGQLLRIVGGVIVGAHIIVATFTPAGTYAINAFVAVSGGAAFSPTGGVNWT